MYLFRKGFILLFALLFPVIVFLFLKFFGKNEYELLVYKSSCTNIIDELRIKEFQNKYKIKIIDIRLGNDNLLIDNYINKLDIGDEIEVITLSDELRNLNWLNLKADKSLINNLTACVHEITFNNSFILLMDDENNVRGHFNSTDRGDIERLDVEIDILKLENEK